MCLKEDSTPPPPEKPDPNECCGSGCSPCIYDYYYDNLAEWEEKYGKIEHYVKTVITDN